MSGTDRERLLRSLYEAFNARDVDTCLAAMTPDAVHLVARNKAGKLLAAEQGHHVYDFRGDLVQRMTIQE